MYSQMTAGSWIYLGTQGMMRAGRTPNPSDGSTQPNPMDQSNTGAPRSKQPGFTQGAKGPSHRQPSFVQGSGRRTTPKFATAEWQEIAAALRRLFSSGVLSPSGHGNLSTRLHDDRSRLLLKDLVSDDLAVLPLTGEIERGGLSAETRQIVCMHTIVYQMRPEVGAVVHSHSPYASAFALAHRPLPCRYESLLHFGQVQDIPVAAWGPRGSQASVQGIAQALDRQPQTQAVLLANHGVLAFGADAIGAVNLLIAIEEAAAATLRASLLGGAVPFPEGAFEHIQSAALSETAEAQAWLIQEDSTEL